MSDYCNPLTDDELLSAKIVYPQAEVKTEDALDNLAGNKTAKHSANLAGLHGREVRKQTARLDENAIHKTHKQVDNTLSTGARVGKQSANITFKNAAAGKVSNAI